MKTYLRYADFENTLYRDTDSTREGAIRGTLVIGDFRCTVNERHGVLLHNWVLISNPARISPQFSRRLNRQEFCSILSPAWASLHEKTMQRWTARFLLLFTLVGTLVPLGLAASTAPPHACCIRLKTHHCHGSSVADSDQLTFHSTGCCNHDCCRAVTTSQWANPQPGITGAIAQRADARVAESYPRTATSQLSESQSTRAPPAC
jgi:hypothetical protein